MLRAGIILCSKEIEAQVPVRRRLGRVQTNGVTIVVTGLIDVAELGVGDPHEVLNGWVTGRNAMCLFELDERLIESPLANETNPLLQRRGLCVQHRGESEKSKRRSDP